jgi:RecA/RadA recombinase
MIFPIPTLNSYFIRNPLDKGIISVWGDFGVGKTTFALQTLYNTYSEDCKSIYVFTKPTIPYEQIYRIMQNSKEHLDPIDFIKLGSFSDLYNVIFNLEFLILRSLSKQDNQYKLIIIDSLTDLYRIELDRTKKDMNYNLNYQLNQILANLFYLNFSYNVEILVINEKVQVKENDQSIEIQSGGKVMEYWITLDIKIERTKVLKEREFILSNHSNGDYINFQSNLSKNGFE